MGQSFTYKCENPACGYSAVVCGKKDWGISIMLESMICGFCEELVDVVVAKEPNFEPVEFPKCKKCGFQSLKKFYPGKSRCPKCKSKIKYDPTGDSMLWD